MKNIAFIGIGQMGKWMARNLVKAGYSVVVYDINVTACEELRHQGARVAPSAAEAAKGADAAILMLPHSTAVESVVDGPSGLLAVMQPGTFIIDMGSSYVLSTKRLATLARERGLHYVDAPVSGGVKGAREATLTIMVGATPEEFEAVLPLLSQMGKKITHVGESGAGHALKALNNYLSAASLYATTEAMVLAKALGLDLKVALDAINSSSGQSYSTHYKFPTFVLPRTFDSGFSLDLLLKDVKMVTAIAQDLHIPVFMAGVVAQLYEAARGATSGKQDHTEIVKFLENLTNIRLEEKEATPHEP